MPSFKQLKTAIRAWLDLADWTERQPLPPDLADYDPKKLVSPLVACLPEAKISERAAYAFGWTLNQIQVRDPENAREIMRRLLWQMNEESGNIAWGVPLAFAQALAQNRTLADLYHRILFHYIYDKEGDSTYCDFAPLRLGCYQALQIVLRARPDLAAAALPLLQDSALRDQDPGCRLQAQACLALAGRLADQQ